MKTPNLSRLFLLPMICGMAACGAINSLEHNLTNPSPTTDSATNTSAAQLSSSAAQVNDPNMQPYLTACAQQTPACQQVANNVGQDVEQAVQRIQANQDATAALQKFDSALQDLVTCMQKNTASSTVAPSPPAAASSDVPADCTKTTDSQGTVTTVCTSASKRCTTQQKSSGEVAQTCVCGAQAANPNDPNMAANPNAVGNPNAVVVLPTPTAVTDPNTGVPATDPNAAVTDPNTSVSKVTEQCTAQVLPDKSTSVTCTCNVRQGGCSVQATSTP